MSAPPFFQSTGRGDLLFCILGVKRRTNGSNLGEPIRTRKGKLVGGGKHDANTFVLCTFLLVCFDFLVCRFSLLLPRQIFVACILILCVTSYVTFWVPWCYSSFELRFFMLQARAQRRKQFLRICSMCSNPFL